MNKSLKRYLIDDFKRFGMVSFFIFLLCATVPAFNAGRLSLYMQIAPHVNGLVCYNPIEGIGIPGKPQHWTERTDLPTINISFVRVRINESYNIEHFKTLYCK